MSAEGIGALLRAGQRDDAAGIRRAAPGATPEQLMLVLATAAACERPEAVAELLAALGPEGVRGPEPALWAAKTGSAKSLELLLPGSAAFDESGALLAAAAGEGNVECLEALLARMDPLAGGSAGLRAAARNGQMGALARLLPVSDARDVKNGMTAAQEARSAGQAEAAGAIEGWLLAREESEALAAQTRGLGSTKERARAL